MFAKMTVPTALLFVECAHSFLLDARHLVGCRRMTPTFWHKKKSAMFWAVFLKYRTKNTVVVMEREEHIPILQFNLVNAQVPVEHWVPVFICVFCIKAPHI